MKKPYNLISLNNLFLCNRILNRSKNTQNILFKTKIFAKTINVNIIFHKPNVLTFFKNIAKITEQLKRRPSVWLTSV